MALFDPPYQLPPVLVPFTDNAQTACLYVIEIAKNRIKVGFSHDPTTRLASHRGLARAHGGKPGREWISPRGSGTGAREAELIRFCASRPRSRKFAKEYFSGVPFLDAVQYAAQLCGDSATLRRIDDELTVPTCSRSLPVT